MSGDALPMEMVHCPDCGHLLGKVTPVPGTTVSYQCRRCRRIIWYVIPALSVLERVIKVAKTG